MDLQMIFHSEEEADLPDLEFYQEYMAAIAFFKAMKELRERYLKEGKDDGQDT